MNRVVRALPRNPQLEQYKKQAKELVKAHGEGDAEAGTRIRDWLPRASTSSVATILAERFTLSDAQLVLAREHGFQSWPKLKQRIEIALARPYRAACAEKITCRTGAALAAASVVASRSRPTKPSRRHLPHSRALYALRALVERSVSEGPLGGGDRLSMLVAGSKSWG